MRKDRRNLMIALVGVPIVLPGMVQQDLIADVQRVLHQPSSGPGDKELKFLEQKVRYYWRDRQNITLPPADLIPHVATYVSEVTTLLDRSLLPSIRTRLCACLSEGMFLIGACLSSVGQRQTARQYYQTAAEAAHEAEDRVLQALIWKNHAASWAYSNEPNREKPALDSMLKARHFAFLESDIAVQCEIEACLAELYALSNEKAPCLAAFSNAARDGYGQGDRYYIHRFDPSRLNAFRGFCLQQFSQNDDSDAHSLLEESRQALQELLSQVNIVVRNRSFLVVDMAQLYAREGEVEAACNLARQVIGIVGTDSQLQKRLGMVRTQLEPYADAQVVRDLNKEMRVFLLQ